MGKEEVQTLLDDFIIQNDSLLAEASKERPPVYDAVMNAMNFLSRRFGTGEQLKEVTPIVVQALPVIQEKPSDIVEIEKVKEEEETPTNTEESDGQRIMSIIGKEFKAKGDKYTIYQLAGLDAKNVVVTWDNKGVVGEVKYTYKEVLKQFDDGIWELVGQPKKQKRAKKTTIATPKPSQSLPSWAQTIDVEGQQMTEDEIKEAIANLKPLIGIDPDVDEQIKEFKSKLKELQKSKKLSNK